MEREELREASTRADGTLLTISQRVDCCQRQEEAFNETRGCISSEGVESDEISRKSELVKEDGCDDAVVAGGC